MLFAEKHRLLLLIAHAISGGALVAASTHLAVRMRGYGRGRFARPLTAHKIALISLGLFAAAFLTGNLLHPTYQVRVRAEYLEDGIAVVRDYRNRMEARHRLLLRQDAPRGQDAPAAESGRPAKHHGDRAAQLPQETAKLARWFDVKLHWAALGFALATACTFLMLGWDPHTAGAPTASMAFALAALAAATAWLGAIIGVAIAASRSVGALG